MSDGKRAESTGNGAEVSFTGKLAVVTGGLLPILPASPVTLKTFPLSGAPPAPRPLSASVRPHDWRRRPRPTAPMHQE